MTDFPLPTMACTVDENGISSPTFDDVLGNLQFLFRGIFGQDIYLGNDSQDGQWLGILAAAISDSNDGTVATYNQFSPQTAVGVGLSQVVKVNGIRRQEPSNSTVDLVLVGQAGRTINSGLVGDAFENQWALPASVTFPPAGQITVTATCQTAGAVNAQPNTVTQILTPQAGWQSATNPADAAPGAPVELDSALRQRQSISTSLPALTPLEAVTAAVANVAGVTRVQPYENDTGTTDVNGIPGHTICMVTQGGDAVAIATAIADKKTPGTGTFGSVTEVIIDQNGVPNTIKFQPLLVITVSVLVNLKAFAGYVSTTGDLAASAVALFLSDLPIGDDSYLNRLLAPLNLSGDAATLATGQSQTALDALSATYNVTSVYQAREDMIVSGGPYSAGTGTITVGAVAGNIASGQLIGITLSTGAIHYAAVTSIAGANVTFTPVTPALSTVNNGALVYVAGDLVMAFDEGANTATTNVTVTPS